MLYIMFSKRVSGFVTKESGIAGEFDEKAEAARIAGATLVVIKRPIEEGMEPEEIKRYLEKM